MMFRKQVSALLCSFTIIVQGCGEAQPPIGRSAGDGGDISNTKSREQKIAELCRDAEVFKRPLRHRELKAIMACLNREQGGQFHRLDQFVQSLSNEELDALAEVAEVFLNYPEWTINVIEKFKEVANASDDFDSVLDHLQNPKHELTQALRGWRSSGGPLDARDLVRALELAKGEGWGSLIQSLGKSLDQVPEAKKDFVKILSSESALSKFLLSLNTEQGQKPAQKLVQSLFDGASQKAVDSLLQSSFDGASVVSFSQKLNSELKTQSLFEPFQKEAQIENNLHGILQLLSSLKTAQPDFLRRGRDFLTMHEVTLQEFSGNLLNTKITNGWIKKQREDVWKKLALAWAAALPSSMKPESALQSVNDFFKSSAWKTPVQAALKDYAQTHIGRPQRENFWEELFDCIDAQLSQALRQAIEEQGQVSEISRDQIAQWVRQWERLQLKVSTCKGYSDTGGVSGKVEDVLRDFVFIRLLGTYYGTGYHLISLLHDFVDYINKGNPNPRRSLDEHASEADIVPLIPELHQWIVSELFSLNRGVRMMGVDFLFKWVDFNGILEADSIIRGQYGLDDLFELVMASVGDLFSMEEAQILRGLMLRARLLDRWQTEGIWDHFQRWFPSRRSVKQTHAFWETLADYGAEPNRESFKFFQNMALEITDPERSLAMLAETFLKELNHSSSPWTGGFFQHAGLSLNEWGVDFVRRAYATQKLVSARASVAEEFLNFKSDGRLLEALAKLDSLEVRVSIELLLRKGPSLQTALKVLSSRSREVLEIAQEWAGGDGVLMQQFLKQLVFFNDPQLQHLSRYLIGEVERKETRRFIDKLYRAWVHTETN